MSTTATTTTNLFTCVTCHVAFNDAEVQRAHYKTDWHRYNLKRKVAELPPISAQSFVERVQLQKSQIENAKKESEVELFCKICGKHFSTRNSYSNHLQSKRHKELEAKSDSTATNEVKMEIEKTKPAAAVTLVEDKNIELLPQAKIDEDNEWEDIEENEDMLQEFDESKGIDLNTCLFCDFKASKLETKIEHMAREHSFFIPNADDLTDAAGLMKFLGIKLGVYHVCLWCSNKCYPTLKAVQQHMADKGHFKMKFEGETMLEYADFYSCGGDEGDDDEDFESVATEEEDYEDLKSFIDDETYELTLPSGKQIGHRSLFRYFKQSFGHRNLELKQMNNISLRDKYRALGYKQEMPKTEIQAKRKDLACFQRWKAHMHTKLGVNQNKLQKHFRRQDITF